MPGFSSSILGAEAAEIALWDPEASVTVRKSRSGSQLGSNRRGKKMPDNTHSSRFESLYQEQATPWEINKAQPAIQALAEAEKIIGDVLDLGCGTGENTLLLASRGHMTWGIDASATAIEKARQKAVERHLSTTFVVGDALALEVLGEGFHTVIDSGLFHVFSDSEREAYLSGLRHVMFPDSLLFLICFSDQEPGDWGPRRVKRSELRQCFALKQGFKVLKIESVNYHLNLEAGSAKAWLATIQRVSD